MKKIFLFLGLMALIGLLVATINLAGKNSQKDKRIENLLDQNNEWTEKVTSLETEKKDGEAREEDLKGQISSLEGEIHQRDYFVKKLAIRLPLATVVNVASSIALTGEGMKDLNILSSIFFIGGEEADVAWTNAEEKKLVSIAGKIFAADEVVVVK